MKKYQKAISFAVVLLLFSATSLAQERYLKKNSGQQEYSSRIESPQNKCSSFEGETSELHLRITNQGKAAWESSGKNPCFVSFHLLDEEGNVLRHDNKRYAFPQKVLPGQTAEMAIKLKAPLEKGKYILEFDLVREGIAWFKDYESKTLKMPFLVKAKKWPEDDYVLKLDSGKYTKLHSSVEEFDKLSKLIRITLNHNEVEFIGKAGKIQGFRAGAGYPQIWLRDANTIIPASRYFYPESFLRSWLEEHLAFQKKNGSLEDWIDSRGKSDKNTTETDQEISVVQAAYQIAELIGTEWLKKKIGEEAIIDRLEKAMNFVLSQRFSEKFGLITGAHTADWGDMEEIDSNQEAIYVDKRTHWTSDIYDQSMFYQACQNLSSIFESLGQKEKSFFWLEKSKMIQRNTDKWLWQDDKGFYKVHLHLDALVHDFDEGDMFAMGGNTQAIISGLASKEKCKRIIEEALLRQKSFHISTISGTLLPPYPKNFFKHPMMDDPFEYQNGGQWDWFGGKLIYAMFESGFSRQAKEKLLEVARKNIANGGLFEWDTKEGIGQGSDFYSGSAGSLSKALFEGYFGLHILKDSLEIEPKLDQDEAKIHFYVPAADLSVAYEYRFSKEEKNILLELNSNFPGQGKIKILNPWQNSHRASKEGGQKRLEVMRDGVKIPFLMVNNGSDEFIVIETDFKRHSLKIKNIE